ncbi:hypothetical protein F2Q68_00044419 [Brassica cretica]|uniref:Uncharacterized protein n=1 Tax=Brassica cretica TaxID=69181 RepID=A0A8S9LL43_BRACR|nr:hypothetical protein F2Q68_00044419 [Brassica cretica]
MSSLALRLHIPSVVSVRNTKLLGRSVSDCGRNWSGLPKSKSRRGNGLCCKAELSELAPAVSAGYGVLLLGGGLFASSSTIAFHSSSRLSPSMTVIHVRFVVVSYIVCSPGHAP